MASMFGGAKTPVIPAAPPAAAPATMASSATGQAASGAAQRAAIAGGLNDPTVGSTGAQGVLQTPSIAKATLLGQ